MEVPEVEARACLIEEATNEKGLKWLVDSNVAQPLNIVFDIDHTLIFSTDRKRHDERMKPGSTDDTHLLRLDSGHEMVLVVRQGVAKTLEFLS